MKENEDFELNLNHMTVAEHSMGEDFEEYKGTAALWQLQKGLHLFAEDILRKYAKGATLEEIFCDKRHQSKSGFDTGFWSY